jgi:hypothetical protein
MRRLNRKSRAFWNSASYLLHCQGNPAGEQPVLAALPKLGTRRVLLDEIAN